ncbi:MAG: radical SAM family heme chaperone HemW [Oscillospiraceae bacterium]|nr:radical SAM family heme chaperone HemW [Oscillospiraceae bacterium]
MTPLGIYIHIPFCLSKCAYCDFYSRCGNKNEYKAYTDAVASHIEEAHLRSSDYEVDTIYFGGGTPTAIGEKNLIKILGAVLRAFRVSEDCEVTCEANPNSVTYPMLKRLRRAGFNRISFGMQSADRAELRTLGRTHTFEDVKTAVDAARRAKFRNISLDLMYGLPSQTTESFLNSLDAAIALSPEHISCYSLKIEEGTPLAERPETLFLPSDDDQADMYLAAVTRLSDEGFQQYEISNFAKEGFFSRHNMKYWTLGEYWGFGPSAHSLVGKKRFSYIRDTALYIDAIENRDQVIDKMETINESACCGEYLMLGLRTADGISGDILEKKYLTYFDEIEKVLLKYHKTHHAEFDGIRWHLTPEGFLISNRIIGDVLDALESSEHLVRPFNGYVKPMGDEHLKVQTQENFK